MASDVVGDNAFSKINTLNSSIQIIAGGLYTLNAGESITIEVGASRIALIAGMAYRGCGDGVILVYDRIDNIEKYVLYGNLPLTPSFVDSTHIKLVASSSITDIIRFGIIT